MNAHRPSPLQAAGQAAGTPGRPAASAEKPCVVDSDSLLGGRTTLLIRHQGEIYRLQTTRQGKLILTK